MREIIAAGPYPCMGNQHILTLTVVIGLVKLMIWTFWVAIAVFACFPFVFGRTQILTVHGGVCHETANGRQQI